MVENDGSVVIGEFGLRWTDFATDYAKLKQSPMTTQLPVRWVAPELFNNFATCNHATEVWSYGVTVWEIATVGLVTPPPPSLPWISSREQGLCSAFFLFLKIYIISLN